MENKDYYLPQFLRSTPVAIITLALSYVVVARLSLLFMGTPGISTFYPAIGLCFSAVLMFGNRLLPGVFLGSFMINMSSFQPLTGNSHHFVIDIIAFSSISLGNVIGIYTGTTVTKTLCKGEFPLVNSRNVLILLLTGVFVTCLINSIIGSASLLTLGYYEPQDIYNGWLNWWMGDSIGVVATVPFILSWNYRSYVEREQRPIVPVFFMGIGTIILCYLVFFHLKNHTYLFLPLMLIASYVFCMRVTTAVILVVSIFSFVSIKLSFIESGVTDIEESFLRAGMLICVLSASSLTFAGVLEEQQRLSRNIVFNEEKYRTIFENMQDVYIQSTVDGVIVDVSPSIYDFVKAKREDVVGENVKTFYTEPKERDVFLKKLLKYGKVTNFVTTIMYRNKADIKHISINARIILNSAGIPTHIVTVLHDETDRIRHMQKIEEQNLQLQEQNKELEQFVYIASHDLQEPLTTLQQFTLLVQQENEERLTEDGKTYIKFIMQSTARMQALVKGLLSYSRIGNEKDFVSVDCNIVVSEVLQDLSHRITTNNAEINVGELPKIKGHIGEIRQLFQNLISNAMKFQIKGNKPQIDVTAEDKTDSWLLSIKDNGIGIDQKDADKVFVIFKRLHNREEFEGTGIGLALCKKIVERHGGKIWIESELGKGCNFKILIPKLS